MHVMQVQATLSSDSITRVNVITSSCLWCYRIQGTTGVELVSGLHWYLKYWCGAHISWDKTGGAQLASVPSPGSLPHVKGEGVKIERPVTWNYYQNVVTSSCESFLSLCFCFQNPTFIYSKAIHIFNIKLWVQHHRGSSQSALYCPCAMFSTYDVVFEV